VEWVVVRKELCALTLSKLLFKSNKKDFSVVYCQQGLKHKNKDED